MTPFWKGWLLVWCGAVAVFGLALMGAATDGTSGPIVFVFDLIDGDREFAMEPYLRFTMALLGAVTLGWGMTFYAAFDAAFRMGTGATRTWRLITLAAVTWYVVDSGLSVYTGFGLNALPNTAFIVGYLVPVLASGVLKK